MEPFPPPLELARGGAGARLARRPPLATRGPEEDVAPARARLARGLGAPAEDARAAGGAGILLVLDPALPLGPRGFEVRVDPRGVQVVGGGREGLFHGAGLALGLLRRAAARGEPTLELPGLVVRDRPDLARRGLVLDVSRDRVPRPEELRALVDLLAELGMNELQLYVEHAFAYRGHEEVWRDASPLEPGEMRALDEYARERCVELVPSQQSLGHLHRWLRHARYRELAECPQGVRHPFSDEPEPYSLCPTDPRGLELLADLYGQLLPCFASRRLHVGLDEPFDLGLGRSAAAAAARGTPALFLEHLCAVHALAAARGRRIELWADFVLEHPELARELPRDVTLGVWGYEADHPFDRDARAVHEAGLAFATCPGTSSWQSVAGRTRNALENVAAAARAAAAHGAEGLLVTDWGDRGHWQPPPISWPGIVAAATWAWRTGWADALPASEVALALERRLDTVVLRDRAGAAARALLDLGRAGEVAGGRTRNGTALFFLLALPDAPVPGERTEGITVESLGAALEHVVAARATLARTRVERPDAALVRAELEHAADLLALACRLGIERLRAAPDAPIASLPAGLRADLAQDLRARIRTHQDLWLARSRPGGLPDSTARFERLLARLES